VIDFYQYGKYIKMKMKRIESIKLFLKKVNKNYNNNNDNRNNKDYNNENNDNDKPLC
jgi:hypothetical protein